MEEMLCEECGKDSDMLHALHSGKDRLGNCTWLCINCIEEGEDDNKV